MPPKATIWKPDPHTLAKHDLLRRYLGAWFPVMARWERKLIFIDGFAGPGVYETGEPGSPLVALQTLLDHQYLDQMNATKFIFIFVEQNTERHSSLEAEVAQLWKDRGGQPSNIAVNCVCAEFEDAVDEILDSIPDGFRLAPTLAFVDPFGFKGVSLAAITRITSAPKCEVIFSFMYDGLNRWITHPDDKIHVSLVDLFGTDDYRDAAQLAGDERRSFLHDLYQQQLMGEGRFEFSLAFGMIDKRGKNVYSLVHATRHIKGLEAMKDAMWFVDESGEFQFSDRHHGVTPLFGEDLDITPLREAMLERFAGQEVRVDTELHQWVITDTIYKGSHYKKLVLKELEDEGIIEVVDSPRKKGWGYPERTVVRFP